MNNKHPSHFCSVASFVAVIALLITLSALPVRSDAFNVNSDTNLIGRKSFIQKRTLISQPFLPWAERSKLFTEISNSHTNDSVDIVKLRCEDSASLPFIDKANAFISKNFFLLGMIAAVSFAKIFPELGKNGSILRPELFIGKYGVTTIFLLSGLSLKLQELTNAAANMKLNGLIQMISFGAWPFLVGLPLTKGIELFFPSLLPTPLLEGVLILCCLPTTINMCIILTSAAGGSGEFLIQT